MTTPWPVPVEGGCACGAVRYRLERSPMFVQCCNCHSCQRETGTAFALNAMIEAEQVTLVPSRETYPKTEKTGPAQPSCGARDLASQSPPADAAVVRPKMILLPSESGLGQMTARCPRCYVTVWSYYAGTGPYIKFLRVGTLDKHGKDGQAVDDVLRPDILIFTKFKQPWVPLPKHDEEQIKVVEEHYDTKSVWPKETQARMEALKPMIEEWKKRGSGWEMENDEAIGLLKEKKTDA